MPKVWFDPSVYPREAVDPDRVQQFAEVMREDGNMDRFPPIKVGKDTGKIHDGVHRFQAAEIAEVEPNIEWVDEPSDPVKQLLMGAGLNEHGKPLSRSEKREIARKVWASNRPGYDPRQVSQTLGVSRATAERWVSQFEQEEKDAANTAALQSQQDTPEIAEAKKMLDRGEEIVSHGGELFYRGSYAPDTPREKVEYKKQPDGAVIDYSSVRVEGQEVIDLVIDLRRLMRRVAWVKEAPIFSAMTLDDVAVFSEGASVLSRAALAKKSGMAPVGGIAV